VAEWPERLRDGTVVVLRPIEPADREELARGMERLSPESRYRRFFSASSRLSEAELRYLTEVDHHDHEAIVAVEPDTGEGIGVARFIRSPQDPELAELAVAVTDDWQGRGVGTALLHRLCERAREEGVRRFSASILAENRPMLELAEELGAVVVKRRGLGEVDLEVELPEDGAGQALDRTLKEAASGAVRVRHALGSG
jgi:RimJ/RimL family protein N-acetyltransferase